METSVICSLHMPWDQLGIHMISLSQKVMPVMGNGSCFLNAIDLVLYHDYDGVVTVDHMANSILEHLSTNADYYKQYHTGDLYIRCGGVCHIWKLL